MAQKLSTFIGETREREAWIGPAVEREGGAAPEREQLLASAALIRGVAQAIVVPDDAEERSRAAAVALLQQRQLERHSQGVVHAPWYLRLGRLMQYVFTLGRRR